MDMIDLESHSADHFRNTALGNDILAKYRARYPRPLPRPDREPWLFDPLDPPQGWKYDPYYEIWIQH